MRTSRGESVAERLFSLLDAFSANRPRLTLSELSQAAGLPLSTTHRLVAELSRWGALERGEDGAYCVGLRLWEVGSLSPGSLHLRERAMPFLEDLYEATHQNVQLAVRDGNEAVYVDRITGRGAVSIMSRMGSRLPLHATGVGLVLLAHAEVECQEAVLAGPLRGYTERTVTSPTVLRGLLADVRRTGYAVAKAQIELVSQSVAAPVRGPGDGVVAALSIVVPLEGVDAHAMVPAVRAAARGISRALGAPGLRSR